MSVTMQRMANPSYAIDAFIREGVNERAWRKSTQESYRRLLNKFVDLNHHKSTEEYVREDYDSTDAGPGVVTL